MIAFSFRKNFRTGLFAYLVLFVLLISLSRSVELFAQNSPTSEAKDGKEKATAKNILSIQKYRPFFENTNEVKIRGLSFSRRFTPDGIGEFLDVAFILENLTLKPIRLYAFIMAYYETNFIDKKYREWIPYTNWRKRDFNEEEIVMQSVSVSPKNILPTLIWDKNDPDYNYYQDIITRKKGLISTTYPVKFPYPPVWKYLEYMAYNPKEGIDFTLPGLQAVDRKKRIQTGERAKPTLKENGRTLVSKSQTRYVLEKGVRETIFRTYHYLDVSRGNEFFNRVAIQFFKVQAADASVAAGEGSKPLFKKIYEVSIFRSRR